MGKTDRDHRHKKAATMSDFFEFGLRDLCSIGVKRKEAIGHQVNIGQFIFVKLVQNARDRVTPRYENVKYIIFGDLYGASSQN